MPVRRMLSKKESIPERGGTGPPGPGGTGPLESGGVPCPVDGFCSGAGPGPDPGAPGP